jgi:hypothetical protein
MNLFPFSTNVLEMINDSNPENHVVSSLRLAARTVGVGLGIYAFFRWVLGVNELRRVYWEGKKCGYVTGYIDGQLAESRHHVNY